MPGEGHQLFQATRRQPVRGWLVDVKDTADLISGLAVGTLLQERTVDAFEFRGGRPKGHRDQQLHSRLFCCLTVGGPQNVAHRHDPWLTAWDELPGAWAAPGQRR